MDNVIIKMENVYKEFDDNVVLNNINISFEKGRICGIVGRNGSGKTLLLKLICGLEAPTSGNIIIEGKNMKYGHVYNIGSLIEAPGYLPGYSGYGYLRLLSQIRNKIDKSEIKKIMEQVGLDYNDRKKIAHYSMGMKQRLGIAQAIMEKQTIVLLDEPLNGIDKSGVEDVMNIIRKLKDEGRAILITGHYEEEVKEISDKVIKMDMGQII